MSPVVDDNSRLRVLAVCAFPIEAAATRFRLAQFVEPLRERGIDLTIRPFLSAAQFKGLYQDGGVASKVIGVAPSVAGRMSDLLSARKYDVLLVQREAMIFGPGIFEWLVRNVGRLPMVLDLDDATYIRYVSPTYGKVGSLLKFFGKSDKLIRNSAMVICGNRFLAEYAESKGAEAVVIPTVVDLDEFYPDETNNDPPVVGWIGTHSTFPFLERLFPILQRLAEEHPFILRIVGSGRKSLALEGVRVENLEWQMAREVDDFRSLDIGLYPIIPEGAVTEEWTKGKSGFKAVQYMAVGVPFVMSPAGICAEMGIAGSTHFSATSDDDWYNSLHTLLSSESERRRMGLAGREFALKHYGLSQHADLIADTLIAVARDRRYQLIDGKS